ncbi:MAG TPA: hypothetical protein VFE05_00115 [Longimicrobiaceae bacterium]|jgi:hypothetical protein|nr:hypothetical protein [Longimicrobiaceae bacterium]
MLRRGLATLLALVCLAQAADAQTRPARLPIPRTLAVHLKADAGQGSDIPDVEVEEIRAAVTMERKDLNGDGVPELFVEGTRFCGTNCERWIYRQLGVGGYSLLYHDWGTGETVLPERAHGWPLITEYTHMSCCEGGTHLYRFDGRHYAWRSSVEQATRDDGTDSIIYRVALTPSRAERPRSLVLDPAHAGGGLLVSARYDLCARGSAASCGVPVLLLQSARLPAGRVCVDVHAMDGNRWEYKPPPGPGWCGVTAPAGGPRGEPQRVLELRPSPRDWTALGFGESLEMRGPGLPGELSLDGRVALGAFVSHLDEVYTLPPSPR